MSTAVQTLADEPEFDFAKAKTFAEAVLTHLNSASIVVMTSIGHKTGLFDAMAKLAPSTSQAIADAAGLNERYYYENFAHRDGVDPHGFRVRLRAIGGVALVPAPEILAHAETARDQVVQREWREQVQRKRVQGAQRAFATLPVHGGFGHRRSIAERGCGNRGVHVESGP